MKNTNTGKYKNMQANFIMITVLLFITKGQKKTFSLQKQKSQGNVRHVESITNNKWKQSLKITTEGPW